MTVTEAEGRLIYEEAIRRLAVQEADLQSIRTRAGALISGISIATTFLAGATIRDSDLRNEPTALIALGFFVVSLFCSLLALAWRVRLASGYSPATVKQDLEKHDRDIGSVMADLAIQIERALGGNRDRLRCLRRLLGASVLALAIELGCWMLYIGGSR